MLSEIVDCLADEIEGSAEICATEELSFHIEAANKKLIQLGAKTITIGSLDIVSMFANLKAVTNGNGSSHVITDRLSGF